MSLFEDIKTSLTDAIEMERNPNIIPQTNLDYIKSLDLDEFAKFLDCYSRFDDAPWNKWFDDKYCSKCEPIKCKYKSDMWNEDHEIECSYCELETKCRFFTYMDKAPSSKDVCKMWLLEEKK